MTLKRGQVLQVTYEAGYNPIVVPDTDNAFSKKLGFEGIPFLQNVTEHGFTLHFMRPLI